MIRRGLASHVARSGVQVANEDLLRPIIEMLRQRVGKGTTTVLLKVKAHEKNRSTKKPTTVQMPVPIPPSRTVLYNHQFGNH